MSVHTSDLEHALSDMHDARVAFAMLVAPLAAEDMERAPPGGWTLRRVLQHVLESEVIYGKLLAHQRGRTAPEMDAGEPADGADAVRRLEVTRAAALEIVDGIDDETLYRLVKIGHEEYSALSVLQNIASHDHDHYEQIRELRFATRPEAQATGQAVTIRPAREGDLERLTEIYNHYVMHTPITFDLEPFSVEQRRTWMSHYKDSGRHRLLVAEAGGRVLGYATTSQFRTKAAYDTTVETTVYCAPEATGRGIGSALYAALFEAMRAEDIRLAVAGITLPNEASVALHERCGFTPAGVMHGVGRKFGRYWDVGWYEKPL